MNIYVKELELNKIHGIFDYKFKFNNGVNVLFGKNGTGKSTILHILTNILNGDFERFVFLTFNSIRVLLSDNTEIFIEQNQSDQDKIEIFINLNIDELDSNEEGDFDSNIRHIIISKKEIFIKIKNISEDEISSIQEMRELFNLDSDFILPTAYFPSFRTMIDAWSYRTPYRSKRYPRYADINTFRITSFARGLFGEFVPEVNYPSIIEIEMELSYEIRKAQTLLSQKDRELLSTAFLKTVSTISIENKDTTDYNSSSIDELKNKIKNKINVLKKYYPQEMNDDISLNVYNELDDFLNKVKIDNNYTEIGKKILGSYNDLLETRNTFQYEIFTPIDKYLSSVNALLENKKIEITQEEKKGILSSLLGVKFLNGFNKGFKTLSSGERQILTLFYASSKMSNQNIVLVDEPEISLHVDWQRHLLKNMADQLGDCQIIVCTHSPVIGADHQNNLQKVNPTINIDK